LIKQNNIIIVFFLGLLISQNDVIASGHPLLEDKFVISGGAFFSKNHTEMSVDSSTGQVGTNIHIEDDLDYDKSYTIPFASFSWRFGERFRFGLEYFEIDRDNSSQLDKSIHWGDYTFNTNALVKSNFDVAVARTVLGYSFIKDAKKELGIGVGAHLMYFDAKLSGEVNLNGQTVFTQGERVDGIAPLPNIGIYGNYAFNDRWLVSGRLDWFGAKIKDYRGDLVSVDMAIHYQAFKNVGFGANYRLLNLTIDADKDNWEGDAKYEYRGPSLFVTVNF